MIIAPTINRRSMTATQNNNSSVVAVLQSNLASQNLAFQLTWTILRVFAGLLMIHNGLSKLADVQGFADNVVSVIGFPNPVFFTYCAAYVEIISSILVSVGLLTRLNAASLLFTMSIAIYFHLKVDGLKIASFETASLYGLSFLFLLVNGGGTFSVDSLIVKWLTGKK
ncbi:MAG: DoxX family protein [Xenococcaceae cyanobacterium]